MTLDVPTLRSYFPSLKSDTIFLDNPGGTQICRPSLERIQDYFMECNANHGGAFATSRESDALLHQAHAAAADWLIAKQPEEIVFGLNMTTLTMAMSRSLARTFQPGDTLVVTRMDHDANISPWLLAAEDCGCRICWVDFHPEDGTLDLEDFQRAMEEKPRLAAFGYASNALGTINPVAQLVKWAHEAGALTYIDAVQYAPHGPIDVTELGTDFLVCSAYKYYGPHIGVLYGRYDLLDELRAYKVRPAPSDPPGKFETGTQSHEGIAGVLGALEYLEWVGEMFGEDQYEKYQSAYSGRRLAFKQGMGAIRAHEHEMNRLLLETLQSVPGLQIYGITDPRRMDDRVATFSFTLRGYTPRQVAERLAKANINVWDGNYYALAVTERLGLEESGGMVRVGAVHYNTEEEIHRLGEVLHTL